MNMPTKSYIQKSLIN